MSVGRTKARLDTDLIILQNQIIKTIMKSYFRILSALSAVAAVIAFSGCGGKEQEQPKPDPVKVSGVSIDKPTLSMTEGETANLTAIVMPENATNKAVAWKSGNSGVADVDASGKVTAVKAGTSDITVTTADGGKTATCKVTVASKAVPATGLTLSLSSVAFVEGQTKSINATVTPSNTTDEVVWPSPAQLTSNGGGSYTAKKADDSESFDLEVKAGAASAKAGVTVYPMWFVNTSYELVPDGSTYELYKNKSRYFHFSKKKSSATRDDLIDRDILPAGDFTVTSSDNSVATVEKKTIETGGRSYCAFLVSALNVGSSTITVKIGNVSRSFKVTVAEKTVPATGLTLAPKSLELVEGQTKSINATVAPSNSTDNVVWPSSSYLTSNGGGSYTAKKTNDSESFDLEVKAGSVSAKAGVTVYPMWFVESVSDKLVPDGSTYKLDKDENIACFFSKQKFSATRKVLIHNGILPEGDFAVTSSNNSVATVKKVSFQSASLVYNGFRVSALNVGSSTITVKIGDVSRSFNVTVAEKTIPATGLTIDQKLTFVEGQTKRFTATVTPSNSTDQVVWANRNEDLINNGGGSYTAKKRDGSLGFYLEAKAGSATARSWVFIYPMWLVNHEAKTMIPYGSTEKITKGGAIACFFSKKNGNVTSESDYIGKDILSGTDFTVSSSNTGVASVDYVSTIGGRCSGFAVWAEAVGTSTITVKIGNVSRSFKVTVVEKTVPATGLDVTPRNLTFVEGQTKSFSAAVTPSNSTDNVVWPNSSYLTSKGGGTYTANKLGFDNYVGFELDVKAGSVTKKAGVMVYPMWFVHYSKNKYELVPDGSTYELDKNKKIACYFSKKKSYATHEDRIDRDILSEGDFTVTSSDNSVATVRKSTVGAGGRIYHGFDVSALNVGSSTITVKIGNVSRSFKVTVAEKTVPATGLTLTPESLAFVEGQTKSIRATVTPSNSTDNVVWPGSSFLTSNGGGSYTAKQYDGGISIGFGLDVRAGSVKATANVIVYRMQLYSYDGEKFEYELNDTQRLLKKNKRIVCYFAKYKSPADFDGIINKGILPAGDFTVTSSDNSVATVKKESINAGDRECNGFSVTTLNLGRSTITVKIGNVSRSFDVLVTK